MSTVFLGYSYDPESDVLEFWYSTDRDFIAEFGDNVVEVNLSVEVTSDDDLKWGTDTGVAAWAELNAFGRILHDDLSALRPFAQLDEQIRGIQ